MKINQLKAGSLLSYVRMVLSVLISLVYTPIVLNILGKSEYGLYQTAHSITALLTMLTLGLNISYVHFYLRYHTKKDYDGLARFNGLYMTILTVLGLIGLVLGLLMTWKIEWIFADGLTASEYQIARMLMLLLVFNTTLSFPISTFTGILTANEKFVFINIVSLVKTVATHGFSIVALLLGFRSVGMVTVLVTSSVLVDLAYIVYAYKKLHCQFKFSKFEQGLFKSLLIYTSFIAINVVVDQVNMNIDKMLLARFCGTEAVAVYNIGFLIYTYYQTLSTAVSGVFSPRVHKYVLETNGDPERRRRIVTDLFIKVGRIQFYVLALVATGFLFFGKAFITCYWANPEYANAYYVSLILIFASMIPLIQNVGIAVLQAINKHKFRSFLYLGIAVANLALTVHLCQRYGEIGAVVGTAIALLVGNVIIINVYYHKKANLDMFRFWKSILRASVGLIPPVVLGVLFSSKIDQSNVVIFLLSIVGYCAVYGASVWCLSMNREERQLVIDPLNKMLKRKRHE